MRFRPCIDIHRGQVKQIVGATLRDAGGSAAANFVASHDAAYYAALYRRMGLSGGHIVMLDGPASPQRPATLEQAYQALAAYPGGLQIGGGINHENAASFISAGASHVIVTSYVFHEGIIDYPRLEKLAAAVGSDRIVLDLSCRLNNERYFIATERWQQTSGVELNGDTLAALAPYCDEFLIHAVDVEGRQSGIDSRLITLLGTYISAGATPAPDPRPLTYAGGVTSLADLAEIRRAGHGRIDVTVGSALDIFGGPLALDEVLAYMADSDA